MEGSCRLSLSSFQHDKRSARLESVAECPEVRNSADSTEDVQSEVLPSDVQNIPNDPANRIPENTTCNLAALPTASDRRVSDLIFSAPQNSEASRNGGNVQETSLVADDLTVNTGVLRTRDNGLEDRTWSESAAVNERVSENASGSPQMTDVQRDKHSEIPSLFKEPPR